MPTHTDDFAGLRGAIARAGLAVLTFGLLTGMPLLSEHGPAPAGSVQVAQAASTSDAALPEGTSCEI
jgi:hypothetical protein